MRNVRRASAFLFLSMLGTGISAPTSRRTHAAPANLHVCAEGEGALRAEVTGCSALRARYCDAAGTLARCECPPGGVASSALATTLCEPKKSASPVCVIADNTIADTLTATYDFHAVELPPLDGYPPLDNVTRIRTIEALERPTDSDLTNLADRYEAEEGGAARDLSLEALTASPSAIAQRTRRDHANERVISLRVDLLRKRTDQHAVLTVALARAKMRQAGYQRSPALTADALALVSTLNREGVVASSGSAPARALRDSAFLELEAEVRAKTWSKVEPLGRKVVTLAAAKIDPEDPKVLAATWARIGQARIAMGDLAGGKSALVSAIEVGVTCAPTASCVSAAMMSRAVLARVSGALGEGATSLIGTLRLGVMPRAVRIQPLVQLASLQTGAKCLVASEESRAWAHVLW